MRTNAKPVDPRTDASLRLAGGYGPFAAQQTPEARLRRSVLANLLWEDQFYEDGVSVADNIRMLIPQAEPEKVATIAVEARVNQKLRHVPLFLAREMARLDTHKGFVGGLLPRIILRADELAEFMALYWKDGKCPLSKQVKKGLRGAFLRFDGYQLAKYNRDMQVKLRDVLFMVHAKPTRDKEELFKQLAEEALPAPDTWEVALSAGEDKKETWERLISERKLGALAFVRNLRNMEQAGVTASVIKMGFETINPRWLLPLDYLAAAQAAPRWQREIESLMLGGLSKGPKLGGYSILIIDVSGSMNTALSSKSAFSRIHAAAAVAMLASEMCERISVYATAGDDSARVHATEWMKPHRGFALVDEIIKAGKRLGGGGIFTRQCLEYIKDEEQDKPDRIMVFSDSQDCDLPGRGMPEPFGNRNYIIDVASHSRGIDYKGLWDAEISGWSQHFLTFIATIEGNDLRDSERRMP